MSKANANIFEFPSCDDTLMWRLVTTKNFNLPNFSNLFSISITQSNSVKLSTFVSHQQCEIMCLT